MALLSASITPTNLVTTSGAATLSNKTFSDNPTFSGGTANGVPYLNGSKVLTSGSDLVFNGTNFGIGTSSPEQKLDVVGALNLRNSGRRGTFEIDSSGNLLMGTGTTAGNLIFETGHSGGDLPSTGTERVKINQYGIGLGASTPSSGTGITFPATQSASSNANTLDDYEEGTWTPVVSDAATGGNLATLSDAEGVYTKIGNVVYWRFNVVLTSTASMTSVNDVFIQGFPFQSAAITNSWYNPNPTIIRNITFTDFVQFTQIGNTTRGLFRENVSNANGSDILVSDLTNSSAMQASGFYRVA